MEERKEVLAALHRDFGHRGRDTTYKALAKSYWWPQMYKDVKEAVQCCAQCQSASGLKYVDSPMSTKPLGLFWKIHVDVQRMPADCGHEILCIRTIEQTSEPIRFEQAPDDERWTRCFVQADQLERWMRCFVPADQLEQDNSAWIKHIPGVHVVGGIADEVICEVAVRQSWAQRLGFPFDLGSDIDFQYDASAPMESETEVLESVGGKRDNRQRSFDMGWSTNDNFLGLGRILDLDPTESVLFGSFEAQGMRETLKRSPIFDGDGMDVEELKEKILRIAPPLIGPSEVGVLCNLALRMTCETMMGFRMRRDKLYRKAPLLNNPENVFLIHCTESFSVHEALCDHVVSDEGRNFCRGAIERLRGAQEPEQAILILQGLNSYEKLLPSVLDEVWDPIHCCYLLDYGHLLGGQELKNRRAVWQRMIFSINRIYDKILLAEVYSLLQVDTTERPSLHWYDGISDQYWRLKLGGTLTHDRAWKEMRERFKKQRCIAAVWDVEDDGWVDLRDERDLDVEPERLDEENDNGWLVVGEQMDQDAERSS